MAITFKQIEFVLAIAEAGSLSKAAQKLYISQPALSQTLKKLESELGTPLFERAGQSMKPTPAGKILLADGQEIINDRQRMVFRLRAQASVETSTLRLGISPFYSKYYLPIIYPYMSQRYPSVRLLVTEAISIELEALTADGEIDLCFVPSEPQNPKLQYETVCMEEILLAAPAESRLNKFATPSTGLPYIDLKHTAEENYIILRPEQKFSALNTVLLSLVSPSPNIIFQTLNWDTVHFLIASGMGVGFIPEVLYGNAPTGTRPYYFRIANQKTVRVYAAAYRKNTVLSPVARSMVDVFRTSVHEFQSSYRNHGLSTVL